METHQTPRNPEPNTILTIIAGSAAAAVVDHLTEWIGSSGWTLFTGWLESVGVRCPAVALTPDAGQPGSTDER